MYVNLKNFTCSSPLLVSNVNALNELQNVFEQDNYTIANIAAQIKEIKLPTATCGAATPAFNGKECYQCPKDKYYKLKTN